MKPLHRILASLALTAAVLTGLLTAVGQLAAPPDTAWGAPATTETTVTITGDVSVTPFDTAWG